MIFHNISSKLTCYLLHKPVHSLLCQVRAHQLVLPPCEVVIKAVSEYVSSIKDLGNLDAIARDVFKQSQVGQLSAASFSVIILIAHFIKESLKYLLYNIFCEMLLNTRNILTKNPVFTRHTSQSYFHSVIL